MTNSNNFSRFKDIGKLYFETDEIFKKTKKIFEETILIYNSAKKLLNNKNAKYLYNKFNI